MRGKQQIEAKGDSVADEKVRIRRVRRKKEKRAGDRRTTEKSKIGGSKLNKNAEQNDQQSESTETTISEVISIKEVDKDELQRVKVEGLQETVQGRKMDQPWSKEKMQHAEGVE